MVKVCSFDYPIDDEREEKYKQYYSLFPYELNPFQKHSIEALIEGNHTLVTAHTGTGKSTCAEFAIHYFVGKGKKVIYCSPIKALSNQKYYDFTQKYPDFTIGLLTGDIKTNPDADVIICTTEILMNYLFTMNKNDISNSVKNKLDFNIDIENDVACIVFDEVHFINDPERGAAWEKSFMMLPANIQLVMLSATIDNAVGFAQWIEMGRYGKTKLEKNDKIVYLSSTRSRIIPLTDYCYMTTNESIFKKIKDKVLEKYIRDHTNKLLVINDSNNKFNEQTYTTVSKLIKTLELNQVYIKRQHILNNLMVHLKENDMFPALLYVYSRKQCEKIANEITVPLLEDDSKVGYTIRRECEQILRKLPNYREYLELPEYNSIVSLLEKGIAIHNSGLLPIIREIVELMIMKKYVKLLICTESFSVGLNAPIKTCIFTSLTKFDNNGERHLTTSEFGQGKGRAGRLGLDKFGTVIHLNNLFPIPTMTEYKQILCGKPQQLISKFHINYGLILNLIKNGRTSDFHLFSEQSMIQSELQKHILAQETLVTDLEEKYKKKDEYIQLLKTPYVSCIEYIRLEDTYKTLVNKKRKDAEREMAKLQESYRSLLMDVKSIREYLQLQDEIEKEKHHMTTAFRFIETQTGDIIKILFDTGFIKQIEDTENHYCFTTLGTIASSIAEIHPLPITQLLVENNYFVDFSTKQLIGLFSCFTDIKIPSDERLGSPNCEDSRLKTIVNNAKDLYRDYQDREFELGVQTGIKYEDALIYDMIDFSMKWCDCNSELECKQFIQGDLAEKSISIGDFNKAMLKIVTVARELANICEAIGEIELLHKLTKVEGLVLKYVTTSQSLYV
jgi:superfamily II RNA helicase